MSDLGIGFNNSASQPPGAPPAGGTKSISPENPIFFCPRRPNIGREGRPIILRANHVQINMPRYLFFPIIQKFWVQLHKLYFFRKFLTPSPLIFLMKAWHIPKFLSHLSRLNSKLDLILLTSLTYPMCNQVKSPFEFFHMLTYRSEKLLKEKHG